MNASELMTSGGSDPARYTEDAVLGGCVSFRQPARGYRVNVDSVLLAHFASQGRRARLALDLGSGVGVVALVLHHLGAAGELALLEREPELAACAEHNLAARGAPGSVSVVDLELMGLPPVLAQRADLVVSNPPFFAPEGHRPPQDPTLRAARQGSLKPFTEAAQAALSGTRARAVFAYPASSLPTLFDAAAAAGLVPKRLRLVHAFADRPARLALVELRRAKPGGLVIEPPLVEWRAEGVRGPELAALSAPRAGDRR